METKIRIGTKKIKVCGERARDLCESRKFMRWLKSRFSKEDFEIESIREIWSFWPADKILLFALFDVCYIDEKGKKTKKLIFYRPDAITVFLVVKNSLTEEKFVVLVEQVRVPAGGKLLEIPAGTLDEAGDPEETAVREIREETGLSIKKEDLKFLGNYYLSPGTLSEMVNIFCCEKDLSSQKIQQLKDSSAGLEEEGEHIKVRLARLEDFEKLEINDAKSRLAYELYLKTTKKIL